MLAFNSIIFILVTLQTVLSQDPPPLRCRGPPPGVTNPEQCCKVPPFFSADDLSECGIQKPTDDEPPRRGPPDCTKQICLLKKYNLMKDDTSVDKEAAAAFFDKWAESNPDFKDAAAQAKDICLKDDLPGPPQICEPDKIMFCSIHVIHANCPKWEETDNCKKLKEHVEECKACMS